MKKLIIILAIMVMLTACAPLDHFGYGKLLYKSNIDKIQYVTFTDGEITRTFQLKDSQDYYRLIIGKTYNFTYGIRSGVDKVWDIAGIEN